MTVNRRAATWALLTMLLRAASCAPSGPSAETLVVTMVAQTAAAQAGPATQAPSSTSTSLPPPTITPLPPTPTDTPLPTVTSGPFLFQDYFSKKTTDWGTCDYCAWDAGLLVLGPQPTLQAGTMLPLYCVTCGHVANYRMSVDAKFGDGPSDRGYGFVVRETADYILTVEITPWQTVAVWRLDLGDQEWTLVKSITTDSVRGSTNVNRIEVAVTSASSGKVLVAVRVNGRLQFVVEAYEELGRVGLYVFGHGKWVMFDDFRFEELEPLGLRIAK
jgi:hypothetical protein